jgi:hypothetical protein
VAIVPPQPVKKVPESPLLSNDALRGILATLTKPSEEKIAVPALVVQTTTILTPPERPKPPPGVTSFWDATPPPPGTVVQARRTLLSLPDVISRVAAENSDSDDEEEPESLPPADIPLPPPVVVTTTPPKQEDNNISSAIAEVLARINAGEKFSVENREETPPRAAVEPVEPPPVPSKLKPRFFSKKKKSLLVFILKGYTANSFGFTTIVRPIVEEKEVRTILPPNQSTEPDMD